MDGRYRERSSLRAWLTARSPHCLRVAKDRAAGDDVSVGARKAVVLWGSTGASRNQAPVPSQDAPWELQEWDGEAWISHGQATTQEQAEVFFADAADE
jgi:hypothetical protein